MKTTKSSTDAEPSADNNGHETFRFDVFISYRRTRQSHVANWLSRKLESYRPSRWLLAELAPDLRRELLRPRRVFLDTRYERGNPDFWEEHIVPALDRAKCLIVVSSAECFERRDDGSENWVAREIRSFWDRSRDRSRILIALAPGAPEDRFPGILQQISPRWDWADLRCYSYFYWLVPRRGRVIDAAFSKLLAGIYDIPSELIPLLRGEERALRIRRTVLAVASVATIAVAGAGLFLRAQQAERRAQELDRRSTASRLVADAEEMFSGVRGRDDERALLELLAAHRIAPSAQVDTGLLAGVLDRRYLSRIIATGPHTSIAAFDPDGSRVVVTSGHTLRMWDVKTATSLEPPLEGHSGGIWGVVFSPDGTRIASCSVDKTVRLWDAKTGRAVGSPMTGHTDEVLSVAFSPDGTRIASGSKDKTIRLWNATTGKAVGLPIAAHTDEVRSVAFSPDGSRIASGSSDETVRLWDANTAQPLSVLPTRQGRLDFDATWVASIAFSPNGSRIAAAVGKTLRFWDGATGKPIGEPVTGHNDRIWSIAFSPQGDLVASASTDRTVRLWDAKTGRPLGEPLQGHKDAVLSVAFSSNGSRVASSSSDGTVRLWSSAIDQPIGITLRGHTCAVTGVAFSPDGTRIASASADKTLRLWNGVTGQPIGAPLEGHEHQVMCVAFSPKGDYVVSGSWDESVRLWHGESGAPIGSPLWEHTSAVTSVAVSPKGNVIASGGNDNVLRLWDTKSRKQVGSPLAGHSGRVQGIAFTPDGTRIVSASDDHTLRVWEPNSQKPVGTAIGEDAGPVKSVALSSDGTRMVSAAGQTLHLWDAKTMKRLGAPIDGHTSFVSSVAFSRPDANYIVSGSADETVRLWDAKTGQPIGAKIGQHKGGVMTVAFSPDGTRMVSGGVDKTVHIWPAPKAWPDELCAKLTHNMSREEWRRWVSSNIEYVEQCPGLPIPP